MAKARDTTGDQGMTAADGLCFRQVVPAGRDEALSLLLTGSPRGGSRSTHRFLEQVTPQDVCLDQLWAAYHNDQPLAAALLVPSLGRTAMYFSSPVLHERVVPISGQLVRAVCGGQDAREIRLIQALLDPDQQRTAQALAAGGFVDLARLLYMRRSVPRQPELSVLEPPFELVCWDESRRDLFAAAILSSYEDTLDCPGLLGLRAIDDIIAGHMATGEFEAGLWSVLLHHRQPVAVMLLNLVVQRRVAELVYLGIHPGWRRQGIGARLLSYGMTMAQRVGASDLVLAVDESNTPALNLYRALQFRSSACKRAMIKALPS